MILCGVHNFRYVRYGQLYRPWCFLGLASAFDGILHRDQLCPDTVTEYGIKIVSITIYGFLRPVLSGAGTDAIQRLSYP
jgi:hypothetical protein